MAWDRSPGPDTAPRRALLGTSQGVIFEAKIDKTNRNVDMVFDLNDRVPITGLEFQQFPNRSEQPPKYFVMLTTPTRLYQFVGAGNGFQEVFANYTTVPPNFTEVMLETPPPPPFAAVSADG